jgi:hypothetical protein
MRIGRRTITKYVEAPAPKAAHLDHAGKLDMTQPHGDFLCLFFVVSDPSLW